MKKTMAGILVTAVAFSALATGASAARIGRRYVDTDNDGICDNRSTTCVSTNFVDADGDGVCDNRGTTCGTNFVDADGDGVCDNRTAKTPLCPRDGTGMQRGRRNARSK